MNITEKKYYEVTISKHTKRGKKNETSMCILGVREPTIEEAGKFLAHDIVFVYKCDHVDSVREISQNEAYSAFCMDDIEDTLPVFGVKNKEFTWEDMRKKYPESREEMTVDREREFVNACFELYEKEGFSEKFWSPFGDHKDRFGASFEIIGRCTKENCHIDVLPMWNIRFEDGTVIGAYPEEIVPSEMKENGCPYFKEPSLAQKAKDASHISNFAGVPDASEDKSYSPNKDMNISIYKIDSSKLIKIGKEGYIPGQEQAKIYFDTIPPNEVFNIDVLDENIKEKVAEMLGINADIKRKILFSVDNRDSEHISMTAYYLSSTSKTAQHYVVSYANLDKVSNYELANKVLDYIGDTLHSRTNKKSEISQKSIDNIISYATQRIEKNNGGTEKRTIKTEKEV